MKEETIATYCTKNFRLQLLKITIQNYNVVVEEIANSVGGYIMRWSDGQKTKIKDHEVEDMAKAWNLHKDNSNYYYKKNTFNNEITIKYQVRLNRKIVNTSISEYTMRKLFAMYVQNQILQLKIY